MLRVAASRLRASVCGFAGRQRGLATPGYVDSVHELIGKTPMVRLRRVLGHDVDPSTKVLVKLAFAAANELCG